MRNEGGDGFVTALSLAPVGAISGVACADVVGKESFVDVDGMEASEHSSQKLSTEDGGRRGSGVSVLGKYFGVSTTQTVVEFAVFSLSGLFLDSQIANGVAIVCSATYNFLMNRNVTFRSSGNFGRSVFLFVLLWIWNFVFSGVMLAAVPNSLGVSPMAVKAFCMACQGGWGYLLCKNVIFK